MREEPRRAVPKKRAVKSFYSLRPARRPDSQRARPKTSVRHGPAIQEIPLASIDWSYTLRAINVEHVERLAGAAELPPIAVWEYQPRRYRGMDGYHRWRLAKHRGAATVQALVHCFPAGPAGEKAFEFECVRSNLQHGLPLTREERNRAIARLWSRWGRTQARPDGHTLDDLGRLFNLTKQRVHQILSARPSETDARRAAASDRERDPANVGAAALASGQTRPPGGGRLGTAGRFSTMGRFSAATRRLRNLLRDDQFIGGVLDEHRSDALGQLRELRALIDEVLAPPA
jgi:hypothetical protein